jgi:hypothetical protein
MAMHKLLSITLFSLCALVISDGASARNTVAKTSTSTLTYRNVTYTRSSSSTCARGIPALRYAQKWWCPVKTTTVSTPPPTTTTTTPPTTQPITYSAQLSWLIPSTRADGTALALSDLAGYEIYYTTDDPAVSGVFTVSGGASAAYTAGNLKAGNYYFTIAAVDSSGLKSAMSNLVSVKFGP